MNKGTLSFLAAALLAATGVNAAETPHVMRIEYRLNTYVELSPHVFWSCRTLPLCDLKVFAAVSQRPPVWPVVMPREKN